MNIAVVGGGSSLLKLRNGVEIDSHDIVIRIKYIRDLNKETTGVKTDILIIPWQEKVSNVPESIDVWVVDYDESFGYELRKFAADNYDLLGISSTTGLNAIHMCLDKFSGNIDVYGYDFYKPSNYYFDEKIVPLCKEHNHIVEEEYFKKLCNEHKRLNWINGQQ